MKKNFGFTMKAMSAVLAVITATGLVSCQDDYEPQNYNTIQESKPRVAEVKGFEGNFKSVNFDQETGQYLTLNVQNDHLTLHSVDANGAEIATSKSANMILGYDGTYTGTLENEVCGVKSFTIRKIGSSYYEFIGQKGNGEKVEFGFTKQAKKTLQSAEDLIKNETVQAMAKKGIKALIDLVPYGSSVSEAVVNQLFPAPPADMKVTDCFTRLNESIVGIQTEIANLSSKLEDSKYNDILTDHESYQRMIYNTNTVVMGKLSSIYEEMQEKGLTIEDEEIESQIKDAIEKWSKVSIVKGSIHLASNEFIYQVAHGYGMKHESYSHMIDAFSERIFAWEHQGYEPRELYRTRDLITCMECEMLLRMYNKYTGNCLQIYENEFEEVIKAYKDNKVVRDTEYAICQIPGANHVKIKFNSLERVPETMLGHKTMDIPSRTRIRYFSTTLFFWHNRKWANLDWFAVPGTNKHWGTSIQGYDTDDVKSHMLTVSEAKKIFGHYDGKTDKKTMATILDKEASVGSIESSENPVLLLSDSKVNMSQDGDNSGFSIEIETVCNLSNHDSAFGKYWYGDFTCTWDPQSEWWNFSSWKKVNSKPMYQVYVSERDDKWTPMPY